jgi:cytochrome c peroxidase
VCEDSPEVNAFSSKYDQTFDGKVKLNKQERRGFALFTDFTFDNLSVPKNPENPVYEDNPDFVDLGLGGFLATRVEYVHLAAENLGAHKVSTLRNVDLRPDEDFVKAYAHNGYFKTLEGIVNDRILHPSFFLPV